MITFKPKLLPTLFTIPALILLLGLSFWQFNRLTWKNNLIKKIEEQNTIAATPLPAQFDIDKMLYSKVIIQGKLLNEYELHMYGGTREFKGEQGYYILTPIKLSNEKIVIVNRGWVPEKLKNSLKRPETIIENLVTIEGTVMPAEKKNLYIHDNQPLKNLWFYINLDEIRSYLKLPIENYYILATEKPNTLPLGKNLSIKTIRNNHLGYALTWLFSAIVLIVIYIRYHRLNQ